MQVDLPGEDNVISICVLRNATNNMARKFEKRCTHVSVSVDVTLNELKCLDCGHSLNPVVWIEMMVTEWHRVDYKTGLLRELQQFRDLMVKEGYVTLSQNVTGNGYKMTPKARKIMAVTND